MCYDACEHVGQGTESLRLSKVVSGAAFHGCQQRPQIARDFIPVLETLPLPLRLMLRALVSPRGAVITSGHAIFSRLLEPYLTEAGDDAAGNTVSLAHLPWHGHLIRVRTSFFRCSTCNEGHSCFVLLLWVSTGPAQRFFTDG